MQLMKTTFASFVDSIRLLWPVLLLAFSLWAYGANRFDRLEKMCGESWSVWDMEDYASEVGRLNTNHFQPNAMIIWRKNHKGTSAPTLNLFGRNK